jgi:hypothetical protein
MKKCFFTLFLMVFVYSGLMAQVSSEKTSSFKIRQNVSASELKAPAAKDIKNIDALQSTYKPIANAHLGIYSGYGNVTPVVYDPVAKALIVVQNYTDNKPDPTNGLLNLFYSFDNGLTWKNKQAASLAGAIPVLASIAIHNTNNVTDQATYFNSLNYRIQAPVFRWNGSQYSYDGAVNYVHFSDNTDGVVEQKNFQPNPGYNWYTLPMVTAVKNSSPIFAGAAMLSPKQNANVQYGAYGFNAFDVSQMDLVESAPDQWGLDKFLTSPSTESSYNNQVLMDADAEGNLYVAFDNFLAGQDPQEGGMRTISVSKSTDGGQTWSELDQMPTSVLSDYVTSQGGITTKAFYPLNYEKEAFAVTGIDEFSYIVRLIFFNSESDTDFQLRFVELYKKGGSWGARDIAPFSNYPNFTIRNYSDQQGVIMDSLKKNGFGNEIQLATTADGQNIIAKWIDAVDKPIAFNPPVQLSNGQLLDTIFTNDVFISYRGINDNSWSEPINATDDWNYQKMTFIPRFVPDLNHIPMISYRTQKISMQNNPTRAVYPDSVQQMIVDAFQTINFTMLGTTGINDNVQPESRAFELKDAFPNPATAVAEISYVLEVPSFVTVEVFDALGQKVATLQNGSLPSGFHTTNLNTANLSSGMYYYTLTVGGKSLTKTLTVVH